AIFGIDVTVIGAVGAELAKDRGIVGLDALTDDSDSDPRDWRFFRRDGCMQTGSVVLRCLTGGVGLVRGPEMCGEAVDGFGLEISASRSLRVRARDGFQRRRRRPVVAQPRRVWRDNPALSHARSAPREI